jgi:hypothetical protein
VTGVLDCDLDAGTLEGQLRRVRIGNPPVDD